MKLSEAVFFEKLAAEKRIELDRAADLSGIKWSAAAESKNGGIDRAPLCVCVCVCVCVCNKEVHPIGCPDHDIQPLHSAQY